MPSAIDERRLRDGASAMRSPQNYDDMSIDELEELRVQLRDGVAAMQSLDDLGSPEANATAMRDMDELFKRYDAVVHALKVRKSK